jgi:hypothetical protein
MDHREKVTELNPGIFQIRGLRGSSHSYVIKGAYLNLLIDSGADQNFPVLEHGLSEVGLRVRDIDLVINTHEHCDHIGANRYFQDHAMVAAYRLAASKMVAGDYYVTMYKGNDLNEMPMRVHLWLENMTRLDIGSYSLRVFHTPGHTSAASAFTKRRTGFSSRPTRSSSAERCRISRSRAASAITSTRSTGCGVSAWPRSIRGTGGFPPHRSRTSIGRSKTRGCF